MWDGRRGRTTVAKHRLFSNPLNSPPVLSTPYRTAPKQRELEREDIDKMQEVGVAEPTITE